MTQAQQNPYPDDDFSKASEHLRIALSLLSRYRIPPSPLNFRIGYDYVAGKDEALKTAFDEIAEQPRGVSTGHLWSLYTRFFEKDEEALEAMRLELRRIVAEIQGEFQNSSGNLSNYADKLKRFAGILDVSAPPATMSNEVRNVIEDTRTMEKYQHQLDSQISSVLDEVVSLRKELEQVKEESRIDALTGISNRKAFDAALERVFEEAREEQTPFSILLADIDHFKKFNDTYGHLIGDKVLRFVGATLKRSVKGRDFAARFGGEEFAVILPQTELTGAGVLAEQIRKAISAGDLKDRKSEESYGKITVSIGIAQFYPGNLPNDLLQRADRALYLAKTQGRDRVEKSS